MNITSGGTPEPVAYLSAWTMQASADKVDVTAFGDVNKTYVAGLPDAQGTFAGFYDDATVQTYQAASDGIARKFYLYPNRNTPGQYWWGTIFPDFSAQGGVSDAVQVSASWNAAGPILKVG
jgi:hypothetical protein